MRCVCGFVKPLIRLAQEEAISPMFSGVEMKPLVTCLARSVVVSFLFLFGGLTLSAPAADTNPPANRAASTGTNQPARLTERAPDLQVADRFLLGIPKSGFGKDYLFTASLIPQAQAATSTGLAAKIVRFELFPDGVDMYESTQGLMVTEDLPARRLLASFPIVRQDANSIVIDFNRGMRRVFTQSWTDASLSPDHDRVLE